MFSVRTPGGWSNPVLLFWKCKNGSTERSHTVVTAELEVKTLGLESWLFYGLSSGLCIWGRLLLDYALSLCPCYLVSYLLELPCLKDWWLTVQVSISASWLLISDGFLKGWWWAVLSPQWCDPNISIYMSPSRLLAPWVPIKTFSFGTMLLLDKALCLREWLFIPLCFERMSLKYIFTFMCKKILFLVYSSMCFDKWIDAGNHHGNQNTED